MINSLLLDELRTILLEDYKLNLPTETVSEIGDFLVQYFESLAKMKTIQKEIRYGKSQDVA